MPDDLTDLKVWSDLGWTQILGVQRHERTSDLLRIRSSVGIVCLTENHPMMTNWGCRVQARDCNIKDKLTICYPLDDPLTGFDKENFMKDFEAERSDEAKIAFLHGAFYADGCSATYARKDGRGCRRYWNITKPNKRFLELASEGLDVLGCGWKIDADRQHEGCFKLVTRGSQREIVETFRSLFYDKRKLKKIPDYILNASYSIRYAFLLGYFMGDGRTAGKDKAEFTNKGQIGSAALYFLVKSLGYNASMWCDTRHSSHFCFYLKKTNKIIKPREEIIAIEVVNTDDKYVYHLETENKTFQAGVGEIIVSH